LNISSDDGEQQLNRKVRAPSLRKQIKSVFAEGVFPQVVVVGDGATGKTSLLNVFLNGSFPDVRSILSIHRDDNQGH